LRIIAWLLVGELVTWETQNNQALRSEFFVQLLQTFILWREATLACSVNNQNWLT
jgi:hypothetical protein